MTKADLDLAHKTAGELAIYAKYVDQLGHAQLAACVRNAASLLQKLVEEAEAEELKLSQFVRDVANRVAPSDASREQQLTNALARLVGDSMYKDHPEASQMAIDALKAAGRDDG